MVYKLISEWKNENCHEIIIFKYNYNHEEMVKYWYHPKHSELRIMTFMCIEPKYTEKYDTRNGNRKWWNYNKMTVNK